MKSDIVEAVILALYSRQDTLVPNLNILLQDKRVTYSTSITWLNPRGEIVMRATLEVANDQISKGHRG